MMESHCENLALLWRSSIQSAKTRQGADCGSDHELLIAKFRLKLKKIEIDGETVETVSDFIFLILKSLILSCVLHGDGLDPCLLYNVTNLCP